MPQTKWQKHLKEVKQAHPHLSHNEAQKKASATYSKAGTSNYKKKATAATAAPAVARATTPFDDLARDVCLENGHYNHLRAGVQAALSRLPASKLRDVHRLLSAPSARRNAAAATAPATAVTAQATTKLLLNFLDSVCDGDKYKGPKYTKVRAVFGSSVVFLATTKPKPGGLDDVYARTMKQLKAAAPQAWAVIQTVGTAALHAIAWALYHGFNMAAASIRIIVEHVMKFCNNDIINSPLCYVGARLTCAWIQTQNEANMDWGQYLAMKPLRMLCERIWPNHAAIRQRNANKTFAEEQKQIIWAAPNLTNQDKKTLANDVDNFVKHLNHRALRGRHTLDHKEGAEFVRSRIQQGS